MGFFNAKPSSTRLMKSQYIGNRSSRHSPPLILLMKVILLALAASAVPFLIISTQLPSLKLFLFHIIPSLWSFSCAIFTPKHLFVLLNVIILSILAMAHLHRQPPGTASLPELARDDDRSRLCTVHRSDSEEMKLDDQECADLQLVDEVVDTNQHAAGGNDILDCSSYGANYNGSSGDTDDDQEEEAIIHTEEAAKEMISETHLQQQESDKRDDQSEVQEEGVLSADDSSDKELAARAGRESKKAEEAESVEDDHHPHTLSSRSDQSISSLQGNDPPPFRFDESLLSEEGSIFTRVESRPLPSARFTHKKASKQAVHDRPHSPLRISRPIVKRGDTLEATWKAICESKRHSSPLHRHYSKHTKRVDSSPLSPIKQRSKKIVISPFHDHDLPKAHAMTSRKPSMPQEELNAKVESFISRFNEQIRIQREKSLLDYMEMVGRGAS